MKLDDYAFTNSLTIKISFATLTLVSSILAYHKSHQQNIPTCDNYALNTYLYVLAMLFFTFFIMVMNDNLYLSIPIYRVFFGMGFILGTILLLAIIMGFTYVILKTDPKKILMKHSLMALFLIFFAILLSPSFIFLKPYILHGVVGASAIAFIAWKFISKNQNMVSPKMAKYSMYALVAIIIFSIAVSIFVKDPYVFWICLIIITLASIIVMSLRLLIHNKEILQNEELCKKGEYYPDYINESFGVYTVLLNLIMDIARLLSLLRGRGRR